MTSASSAVFMLTSITGGPVAGGGYAGLIVGNRAINIAPSLPRERASCTLVRPARIFTMPSALSIVPALYHRMASDGVLRYGSSREEWARTWRDRSLLNPPALLAAIDFEWREMPSLEKHDYWKDEYTFISFAQNGGMPRPLLKFAVAAAA